MKPLCVSFVEQDSTLAEQVLAHLQTAGMQAHHFVDAQDLSAQFTHPISDVVVLDALTLGEQRLTYTAKLAKSKFYSPHGTLLDVAYDPWPSEIAKLWKRSELTAVSGLEMLIFQAIAQLRIFNLGSAADPLPNERAIELAMRDSLGLI